MSDAVRLCVCGHDEDSHGRDGRCAVDVSKVGTSLFLRCCCLGFVDGYATDREMASDTAYNPVTKPAHYSWIPGIECKDVVQHFNYYTGCAIKYLWRYQHKGNPIEDLKKSREYIDNEIARLEKERKK